jgi:GDPmannose 4,6-dehydratase
MWRMLQQEQPDDFVIATGETHSVREFCETAFRTVGLELEWRDSGVDEVGILVGINPVSSEDEGLTPSNGPNGHREPAIPWERAKPPEVGSVLLRIDPVYYRPTEVDILIGDPAKAKANLGWEAKVKFDQLARLMARADLEKVIQRGY